MNQLSIDFSAPMVAMPAAVVPRARRRDPVTSHEAAESMKTGAAQQAERVLKALRSLGEAGAEQIGEVCSLDAYTIRKRLPELQRLGLAAPTGAVRSTASGRSERVWRAA